MRLSERRALVELNLKRVAAGTCRHCGGPVPCHSEFGDRAPGKPHTAASLRAMRKARS